MKLIKSLLRQVLGQKKYLQLVSKTFFFYYKNGLLKNNSSYFNHYYLKKFIKPGDTIIDIGGNLGYYTKIFSRLTGNNGHVYAIEPIPLYTQVLHNNMKGLSNVTIFPYALGEKEGIRTMVNTAEDKYSHGRMHILNKIENADIKKNETYEVEMKEPVSLLTNIGKINYIKCDIEGYEIPVIPLMRSLIEKHHPILQIETNGDNKRKMLQLLWTLGYKSFYVEKNSLIPITTPEQPVIGDIVFIFNPQPVFT
ncbi:MAG: FkbM family methyltransferase [Chitinophagaceae bacterium]